MPGKTNREEAPGGGRDNTNTPNKDAKRLMVEEIEALKKALEAKDKAIEAKDKAIEAKDKAIEAKDKVFKKAIEAKDKAIEAKDKVFKKALEAKDKVIEAKDKAFKKALEAKDKVIEEKDYECSVKEMLENYKDFPEIMQNTAATPSVSNNSNGHKQILHVDAIIHPMKANFAKYFDQFEINLTHKNGDLVKSTITPRMKDRTKLPNFNEGSVAFHVVCTLHDVLSCLGLSSDTEVGQEMSIFALRPDIVVVRHLNQIIMVVEVKNPGRDGSHVVTNASAAGQVYNYAKGLQQMGIDHPFVCLSTYSHMTIWSLEESSDNIFHKAVAILKEGRFNKASQNGERKENPSPEKNGIKIVPCDIYRKGMHAAVESSKQDETECPTIYHSSTFVLQGMFKALYFAIVCGIVAVEDSKKEDHKLIPEEGESVDRCMAMLQERSFSWKTLKCTASYCLQKNWQPNRKVFLHCVLGHGSSGKVYLGSDINGCMFAVKLYLFDKKIMESYSPNDNIEEKEKQKISATKRRDDEVAKWKQMYPSYRKCIYGGFLCEVPCLIMPYVAPIPMKRRVELIDKIEKELHRFAHEQFVYKQSDLRWRHIGLRKDQSGEEKIILIDMESMVSGAHLSQEGIKEQVAKFVKELKERAVNEPLNPAQELIHQS
jgi:hypothetical protein